MVDTDTPWLRSLLKAAEQQASRLGRRWIEPSALALALCSDPEGQTVLDSLRVDPGQWSALMEQVGPQQVSAPPAVHNETLWVLDRAAAEASTAGAASVGAAHILAALIDAFGRAGPTLERQGVTLKRIREVGRIPHSRREIGGGIDPQFCRKPRCVGPIVLHGGGDRLSEGTVSAILDLAQRSRPAQPLSVVYVFAAARYPEWVRPELMSQLGTPGTRAIDSGLNSRRESSRPDVVEALSSASVILLAGGRPELLLDAVLGTPAHEALIDASDRGALIVGSSAGAVVLGAGFVSNWCSGDAIEPISMLGWVPAVVQPHASGPASEQHVRGLMEHFPGQAGLAVDHAQAVVVEGGWQLFRSVPPGLHHQFLPRLGTT